MKVFLADPGKEGPIVFTTRCDTCGNYYEELAERMLQILVDPTLSFVCIQCDPDAGAERISLAPNPDANGSRG